MDSSGPRYRVVLRRQGGLGFGRVLKKGIFSGHPNFHDSLYYTTPVLVQVSVRHRIGQTIAHRRVLARTCLDHEGERTLVTSIKLTKI